MTAGESAKAEPTLKRLIKDEALDGLFVMYAAMEDEDKAATLKHQIIQAVLAEASPPAAERTALKALREKVEALKFKKGVHSNNLGRPILDYNEAINDALAEIDSLKSSDTAAMRAKA